MSEEQKKEVIMPYRVVISLLQLQVALRDLLVAGNPELALVGVNQSMGTLSRLVEEWAGDQLRRRGIIPTTVEIKKEIQTLTGKRYALFLEKHHGGNEDGKPKGVTP